MKVFDKISWHTDAGEGKQDNIQRFQVIFNYLHSHDMLSDDGKELYEIGIDSDASLHSKLLTDKGVLFCERNEQMLVGIDANTLKGLLDAMNYGEYGEYIQDIVGYILGYGDMYTSAVIDKVYALRDNIANNIDALPENDVQRKNILITLVDIIQNNALINKKMGK